MITHTPAASSTDTDLPGLVHSSRAITGILRAEGSVALTRSLIVYHAIGGSWGLFAALFLVPDLSMLGYLKNARVGAIGYNIGHSYLGPALVALGAAITAWWPFEIALIWAAHIGFDRAVGYGLKYPIAFGATHLGWKGRRVSPA